MKNQNGVFLQNPLEKQSQLGVRWNLTQTGHSLICSVMMSSTPLRRLIGVHAIGGSPAFSRHFCIKALKKNCFLDNSRTCCKTKDIFFLQNASLKVMYDFSAFNLSSWLITGFQRFHQIRSMWSIYYTD